MLQTQNKSIKQDIQFITAIEAAAFKLTKSKSVTTEDGAAWRATLSHGRTKIVTVSNGGYGGPDACQFHATTPVGEAADKISLGLLLAIPEVTAAVQRNMMFKLNLTQKYGKISDGEYAQAKANIETSVPTPTEDNIEFVVGRIADINGTVNTLKRAIKTKLLVVFEDGDEKGQYVTYSLPDTPVNRERVAAHEKSRKIAYYIADLFSSTNEQKGA